MKRLFPHQPIITLSDECVKGGATIRRIVLERIRTLFRLARDVIHEDPALAQRYVDAARKVAMTGKVHLPKECRLQVCRHCKRFILPGVNCRVRVKQRREPHVVITCLNCGKQMRMPVKRREKSKIE